MELSKQIKKMLTEDCAELLAYLETENVPQKATIYKLIEDETAMDSLENAILQLTRIFGAFAFKATHAVEVFKKKLLEVYNKYPDFKIFNEIYIKEIALKDINENLSDEEEKLQTVQLHEFMRAI
jgi:hypothetical protein